MQWRSGNAAVCKTAMREFDSRLHLQKNYNAGVRQQFFAPAYPITTAMRELVC